jgi:hypothetical protein
MGRTRSPEQATEYLLTLAESGPERVAKDAIFPAMLARGAEPWRRLLALAKNDSRPRAERSNAVFWVGQGAAEAATRGLQEPPRVSRILYSRSPGYRR